MDDPSIPSSGVVRAEWGDRGRVLVVTASHFGDGYGVHLSPSDAVRLRDRLTTLLSEARP